jgi:hypothetical protein
MPTARAALKAADAGHTLDQLARVGWVLAKAGVISPERILEGEVLRQDRAIATNGEDKLASMLVCGLRDLRRVTARLILGAKLPTQARLGASLAHMGLGTVARGEEAVDWVLGHVTPQGGNDNE